MEFLMLEWMSQPVWKWVGFIAIIVTLMAFDLGILHKKHHEIGVSESLRLSAFYITLACLFGGWVWYDLGAQAGKEYYTAFFVEKSLSLDNVFVISLVFTFFAVPRMYQHKVLFWGIIGVIVLRGIMIGLGAVIVAKFSWILYIFAAFLIFTGIKMLFMPGEDETPDLSNNKALKWMKRRLPVTEDFHGDRFFVKLPDPENPKKKKRFYTPLFLCLVLVELADLVFAVDSVPAVFTITSNPYVVYTSNIFAILGLRALYFALAAIIHRFHYLKYALALVLVFIGSKVFIADLLGLEKFPAAISLGVTVGLIAGGIIVSLIKTAKPKPDIAK